MSTLAERPLFGGAITAMMPSHLIDVSDIRQVPDNQEAFLYPHSSISIIVEVLEKVEPSDNADAVKFHFNSLAHDNSAESNDVQSVIGIPNERNDGTPPVTILTGTQRVAKYNRSALDNVAILLGLFRVESKNIDLVVTMNIPIVSAEEGITGSEGKTSAEADFNALVRTLRIVDYGLFA